MRVRYVVMRTTDNAYSEKNDVERGIRSKEEKR